MFEIRNTDIRDRAKELRLPLWRIAESLKISDNELSRRLRRELDEVTKTKIFQIIEELVKEGGR